VAFCQKLSQATGVEIRLPREAEWEYACRAGTKTRFSFGDDPNYTQLGEYGWYSANSNGQTHPVGKKKGNPWGLYDMHGNVWEWCADWYDEKYYGKSAVSDPPGATAGSARVVRGGSWVSSPRSLRAADRSGDVPSFADGLLGCGLVAVPSGR
jgi:formylglycine-generating enzyme required for sulfatase activity